ncbi:endonuclease/exonuclease/phosphatase family protein [Galbitalea soli]|uniref:Endonuclease/exonuclease/phosphatase family protein n=1 Tax=Galbitalea soli TaxID=1268042 RepID=A0A7C9TPG7_9MICO|nr:endonuclease/exonuclease/phosphatase family protein [Galbitalea soli]NEM90598.1 endonuclease/exonuclease/phosphatase family protein [Galbitalea soli]NYJ31314.1 endonuclease/exonuclease/phosphatase (EEP) superfamily protein YafD [Galbitalea soli]
MIRRILAALVILVVAAALLVAVWPAPFGLEAAPVVAQVVALRGVDVAIALAGLLVFAIIALLSRRARGFAGVIAALLLVFCLASVAVLGSRGFVSVAAPAKRSGDITVLSWNTKGDAPGAAAIAETALAQHADVIALPESTLALGKAIALRMKAAGHPMWVYSRSFDYIAKSRSTTLLISAALGTYTAKATSPTTSVLPTVIATPDDGTGPTFIAVHAVSPIPREMRNWRNDLAWLSSTCTGGDLIMAGDFNSTLDQLNPLRSRDADDFGRCTDAARVVHTAGVGTWPTTLPPLLGAPIDHVLYGSAWRASSGHVITTEDGSGSDHRPIVMTLSPAR